MSKDGESGLEQFPVVRDMSPELLAGPQQAALELLLTGKSIAETARSAGVSRTTVYQWLKSDPVFQAAYNEWHEEMRESSRSRLLMLTDKATNAVEKALESGDAKMGLQLLKSMGMLKDRPAGPTDPDEVTRIAGLEKRKRVARREREEVRTREEEMLSKAGI
jgi:AcrR family transcriptional regulator